MWCSTLQLGILCAKAVTSVDLPNNQKLIARLLFIGSALVLCSVEAVWLHEKSIKVEALHAKIRYGVCERTWNSASLALETPMRPTQITPINSLVAFTVTNRSTSALWLSRVVLEYKSSWLSWTQFKSLPVGKIWIVLPNQADSSQISSNVPSSVQVSTQPLEAGKSYEMYSAFQYPRDFVLGKKAIRLRVCDEEDNCSITPFSPTTQAANDSNNNVVGWSFNAVQRHVDLSARQFYLYGEQPKIY